MERRVDLSWKGDPGQYCWHFQSTNHQKVCGERRWNNTDCLWRSAESPEALSCDRGLCHLFVLQLFCQFFSSISAENRETLKNKSLGRGGGILSTCHLVSLYSLICLFSAILLISTSKPVVISFECFIGKSAIHENKENFQLWLSLNS